MHNQRQNFHCTGPLQDSLTEIFPAAATPMLPICSANQLTALHKVLLKIHCIPLGLPLTGQIGGGTEFMEANLISERS